MNKTVADLALRWLARNAEALSDAERRVLQSAVDRKALARQRVSGDVSHAGMGDRLADSLARIGGSWTFISSFLAFLVVWAIINTVVLARGAFDPLPLCFPQSGSVHARGASDSGHHDVSAPSRCLH